MTTRHPVAGSTYNDARRRYVLVTRDEQGALHALLPVATKDGHGWRERLRQLGFEPIAGPAQSSVSWRRAVSERDLATFCAALCEALGDDALLDLGATFAEHGGEAVSASCVPIFWPNRFLLHIGGTRRCVVFGAAADAAELARVFDVEQADYYEHDFSPPTE